MPVEIRDVLSIWTITHAPVDVPNGKFVARRHVVEPGKTYPTQDGYVSDDLEELREFFRCKGLFCFPRDEDDDPVIVESWF